MSNTLEHAHGDLDILFGDGGGANPRCHWDESVCLDTPVYFQLHPGDPDPQAITYCPRHQVLSIARLLEVHLPYCPHPAREHVVGWGLIDDPGAGAGV